MAISERTPNRSDRFGESPCLILGHPKSGTTLLLALLDSHPNLCVVPEELRFFSYVCGQSDRIARVLEKTGLKELLSAGQVRSQGGERDYSAVPAQQVVADIRALDESALSDREFLIRLMEIWRRYVPGRMEDKWRWVEKTPGNEKFLPVIDNWFGDRAAYVYIVRDPRDTYCSLSISRRGTKKAVGVEDFAVGWSLSVDIALWAHRRLPNFHIIRYESLVNQPEETVRAICSHLDVPVTDSMLMPTRYGVPWSGNSMHERSFEGVSSASVGIHKDKLSAPEIELLDRRLRRYLERFSYTVGQGSGPSVWVSARSRLRLLHWYLRSRRAMRRASV